jgi:hypothetical protein
MVQSEGENVGRESVLACMRQEADEVQTRLEALSRRVVRL